LQWGPHFRKDFEKLDRLRAIIPAARFLALTATATLAAQHDIAAKLLMKVSILV